ncbi:MAG TPA: alpha-L-arabinofuranosidase C-terminal domain-containing protein [Vicinamibacterales bacterium]|nr:alpha-L-arabinofuranosidase C-terminal domain-containing protein [Vicinamibacterales bacterium]
MRTRVLLVSLSILVAGALVARGRAQSAAPLAVRVAVNQPGAAIPSTLFGIFFEDINFAADGGIYPERVKNRSFEFPDPLMGWRRAMVEGSAGRFAVQTENPPSPANQHYLRITSTAGQYGVSNEGYRGIGIRKDARYTVRLLARRAGGGPSSLRVEFENVRNQPQGGTTIDGLTPEWKRVTGTITAEATDLHALVRVLATSPGAIDVDMVSVFPAETWANRENGLRPDLVQLLKDMHPGFLRFPGGCIVEGRYLEGRYQWKTTIGDTSERKLLVNRWNDEFSSRATPDYYQSFGLGFYEYFQLAEDIGASPLPILNCGMACQFNSGELAPLDQIDPYIQDALDLIEFANGPATSGWGAKRAAFGHPAPFNLKMLGVGNEQWGPQYLERYAQFKKVLDQKHPEIRLVASADPFTERENFKTQWAGLREIGAGFVDEHFYRPPDWFFANVGRYDTYPRTGPKIFVGEYAAHLPARGDAHMRPSTLTAAVAEAAFMTSFERNADLVEMSSYAPLFAHVDAWQWTPNLIWFDNLESFGTPSYYAQQTFGQNRGTTILPVTIDGDTKNGHAGLFSSASLDAGTREVIVKLVNPGPASRDITLSLDGGQAASGGRVITLAGPADGENSLTAPRAVAPATAPFASGGTTMSYGLAPNSIAVLRVPIR